MRTLARFTMGFVLMLGLAPMTRAADQAGVVLATVGEVTIERANQILPAQRRTPLQEHDLILTRENARAQLRLEDGTLTTLGADTAYRIRHYRWKAGATEPAQLEFELVQGAFRTITGKIHESPGSTFSVKTPAGNLGIRGTDFWGGYLDGDSVDVLLIDGQHALEVSNQSGTVTLARAGEGTTLKADQSRLAVKTWPSTKVQRAVTTVAWPEASDMPDGVFKATSLPAFSLQDQHGKPHTLDDQVTRILFVRDMGGARLMKRVFVENPGQIDGTRTIAISNVSAMNSFIRNNMALPALRKRPYTIWIDETGVTADLPGQDDQVTLLEVHQRRITGIRYLPDEASLRAAFGLPTR